MFGIATILANAGLDLLSNLINEGEDKAINLIKDKTGIDLSKPPSKDDILKLKEFEEKNKELILNQLELILKDKQSARNMSIELSKSSSWLLKNTGSLIALFVVTAGFILFILLLLNMLSIDNPNVAMILGFVGGYITQILSFYFGSSKTEADTKGKYNG